MAQSSQWQGIGRGVLLALCLALVTIAIAGLLFLILQGLGLPPRTTWAFSLAVILNAAIYFVGITQLLYLIPLVIVLSRQGRLTLVKGLIIGAVIVGLLNAIYLLSISNRF